MSPSSESISTRFALGTCFAAKRLLSGRCREVRDCRGPASAPRSCGAPRRSHRPLGCSRSSAWSRSRRSPGIHSLAAVSAGLFVQPAGVAWPVAGSLCPSQVPVADPSILPARPPPRAGLFPGCSAGQAGVGRDRLTLAFAVSPGLVRVPSKPSRFSSVWRPLVGLVPSHGAPPSPRGGAGPSSSPSATSRCWA